MASSEEGCEAGFMLSLAQKLGTGEAPLRLLISIVLGYPLSIFLRDNLHGTSASTKHLFVLASGLAISYFNYGLDTFYLLFCCVVNFLLMFLIGGTGTSVILSFLFNMGYLLVAYIFLSTDGYDMIWTTPQCILTLRMISVAYDLFDGHRSEEKLSTEQKSLCIKEPPGILEILSYSFYFGYFLAGPQFPLRQYRLYMDGKLLDNDEGRPSDTLKPALRCFVYGVIYILVETLVSSYFPPSYLLTQEFADSSFFSKLIFICLFGKFALNKYLGFWMISESICVLTGIAYTGKDKDGKPTWNACTGFKPIEYELALGFRDAITTFNISTNTWVARYVYKRLKFLGNRYISQAAALGFLATWHGLYLGYYVCFFMEFVIVMFEVQVAEIINKVPILHQITNHPLMALINVVFLKFWLLLFLGYPLIGFNLLTWERMHQVYKQVYYIGHIIFILWPFLSFGVIMPWFKAQKRKAEKEKEDLKKE